MEAFAQDLIAVVNAVKPKKIVLIGHSMGGGIIVEAAPLLQRKVIGLIGVDTLHNAEYKFAHEEYEKFVAPVRKDFVKGSEPFLRSMFTAKSDPALIKKIVKNMSSCPPQVGLGAWDSLFSYDLASALDKIKVPVRSINADKYLTNLEANRRHTDRIGKCFFIV